MTIERALTDNLVQWFLSDLGYETLYDYKES